MEMKHLRLGLLATLLLTLTACNQSNSVTFSGDRVAASTVYTPGLGTANGGFTSQMTHLGNTASISMGSTTKSVQSTTAQGNQIQLNVIGQISQ